MSALPDGVTLAPMVERHLDEVVALELQAHSQPWSRRIFLDELAQPDTRRYLVALDDGRVTGYAGVLLAVDEAHVTNIVVEPRERRRGIGAALLAAALDGARELGASAVTLEVRVGNVAARELYRSFGFAPVGVRPGYYHDGEDALIMWLHDLSTRVPAPTGARE